MELVDLASRSRQGLSNRYLIAKIGFDTAENEPLKVHFIFQPWDFLIFTEPPRPAPHSTSILLHFSAAKLAFPNRRARAVGVSL